MTIVGMGIIIMCYLIGNLMLDKLPKYLWLIIITFSPSLIVSSINPSQPGLVVFFGLIIIYGLIKFYKTGNCLWLLWSVLGNWLSLEIHYSIFSLYPLFTLLFMASFIKWKNHLSKTKSWLIILIAGSVSLFVWIMTTYRINPGDQIDYFSTWLNRFNLDLSSILSGVTFLIKNLILDLISNNVYLRKLTLTVGFILITGAIKIIIKKEWWLLIWEVGIMSGLIIIATQLSLFSSIYYSMSYYVLFSLLLICLMEKILPKNIVKIIFISLIIIKIVNSYQEYGFKYNQNNVGVEDLTDVIYNDYLNNFQDKNFSFNILHDTGFQLYDFSSVILWYWLEKKVGRQLVKLDVNGNNFYPINSNHNWAYLICSNFGGYGGDENNCQSKFVNNYPKEYKLTFIEKNQVEKQLRWSIYRVIIR
jgi:hypothetical protein